MKQANFSIEKSFFYIQKAVFGTFFGIMRQIFLSNID